MEWANKDQADEIEEALVDSRKGAVLAATYDDDEAWAAFEDALHAK